MVVQHETEDEKPLDPAAERLRRKMVRLMAVSIGTMMIGIFAVLFAIVYKMNAAAVPSNIETVIRLPSGFDVKSASRSGSSVTFLGTAADGAQRLLTYDVETGEPAGTVLLERQ